MGMYGSELTIIANKAEVLSKLRTNKEAHAAIVKEARKGYLDSAKAELTKRLDDLANGKLVSLQFALVLPADHTRAYTSAIAALEMHVGDTIELSGSEVRTLILNQWDWMRQFLATNSRYSGQARMLNDAEDGE